VPLLEFGFGRLQEEPRAGHRVDHQVCIVLVLSILYRLDGFVAASPGSGLPYLSRLLDYRAFRYDPVFGLLFTTRILRSLEFNFASAF
jgi:hypothetical protein